MKEEMENHKQVAVIKPIETVYNGYRFRSRLEARWAVFFDSFGIPYEYEPEGYVLLSGEAYLPDFYLPWFKAFVEIKRKNLPQQELVVAQNKCKELLRCDSCDIVLLCEGDPVDDKITIFCNEFSGGKISSTTYSATFIQGAENIWSRVRRKARKCFDGDLCNYPKCHKCEDQCDIDYCQGSCTRHHCSVAVGMTEWERDENYFLRDPDLLLCSKDGTDILDGNVLQASRIEHYRDKMEKWREIARQARFEHGETSKGAKACPLKEVEQ